MMQPVVQPRSLGVAPVYLTDTDRMLGVLQQIQRLLSASGAPRLSDVARLVLSMQHEFGTDASLESVIQSLAGRHLKRQVECLRARAGAAQEVTT